MEARKLIQQERYQLAAKRVKRLKGYYFHVLIFIVINTIVVILNLRNLDAGESYFQWHNFITLAFWGIGLLSHGASVFLPNIIFGKNWENKKIKEFMNKEESDEIKRYE